jgi:hypothetical protein
MPDDVADSGLDLNNRKRRHIGRHCSRWFERDFMFTT